MACGACTKRAAKATYLHTAADGKQTPYSAEIEAIAAVARRGGTYKKQ